MAKKPKAFEKLAFADIVMHAEAEVIKAAYEARVRIDDLLLQREEAYQRIFEIETQIEDVIGEQGVYVFPAPPCPVASQNKLLPATRILPKVVRPAAKPLVQGEPEAASSSTDVPTGQAEHGEPSEKGPDESENIAVVALEEASETSSASV